MTPPSFARIREIFLAAEKLDPAKRAELLEKACSGDPELRAEVESLLRTELPSDFRIAPFWMDSGQGSAGPSEDRTQTAEPPPERIGGYRILEVLGRGGMGVVYLAEQTTPIRREVAIKRLHAGISSRSVIARFKLEQHTLARMDHPGIARVLDAGKDTAGRPYFVMDRVQGTSITDFCRHRSLPLRDRLRLFRQVCDAVQHAHQRGVIHRDLKPPNILVAGEADAPQVRIIDFGIAKAIEGPVGTGALTRAGQIIGTLEYMSPEQASGRAADVDTRSDVYSLGVVLYEMVTEFPPYDLRDKTLLEAIRIVSEEPPRIPGSKESPIDPELQTMLFKALQKEPQLRYTSAAAFGDDLERWMSGLPVEAHPPSSLYQFRKLVTRNKASTILVGLLFLSSIAFGVMMLILFEGQRRERHRAEAEAETTRRVSGFLADMLSSVEDHGSTATVREILETGAIEVGTALQEEPRVEAALHLTIGSAFTSLQAWEEGKRHLDRALQMRRSLYGDSSPEVAETLLELAVHHRKHSYGRDALARADSLATAAFRALDIGSDPQDTANSQQSHEQHPRLASAIYCEQATIRSSLRRFAEADSLYRTALEIARVHVDQGDLQVADILSEHAYALFSLDRAAEAEEALRRALAIYRERYSGDHVRIAQCLHDLSFVVRDPGEKEALRVEYLATQRRLWGDGHPNLFEPLSTLGTHYQAERRLDEAEPLLREALEIAERVYDSDHVDVALASNNLAALLRKRGSFEEAFSLLQRAYETWSDQLGPAHPNVAICRSNLAATMSKLGRRRQARQLLEEAVTNPPPDIHPGALALQRRTLAGVLNELGHHELAADHARAALLVFRARQGEQRNRRNSAAELAVALRALGQLEAAERFEAEADSLAAEMRTPEQATDVR